MKEPEICPAGFVCVESGLSAPVLLCPAGYFCLEGTFFYDPATTVEDVNIGRDLLLATLISGVDAPTWPTIEENPLRPMACPSTTFCLGGVAHNVTIDWIPQQPEGRQAPQKCMEGTYCMEATPTISGTALCFEGHYCPPGVDYPIQAPLGNFAGQRGSVAPTLCFPGTYAPLKSTVQCRICPAGYECPGYGIYEPSLCPFGYYRSLADSVTCRFCPPGTWSPFDGLEDISMCEPCPGGRVCGLEGKSIICE
eukprot:g5186.t1